MNQHHLIFVFGTLKEGFPNFATNRGTRIPGEFQTTERFPFYLVGARMSPWMIAAPGQGMCVQGQVFEVNDEVLADMDRLERIHEADGYRRIEISVVPMGLATAQAAAHAGHQANDQANDQALDKPHAIIVQAYLKPAAQLDAAAVQKGPLSVYSAADAMLYRPCGSAHP